MILLFHFSQIFLQNSNSVFSFYLLINNLRNDWLRIHLHQKYVFLLCIVHFCATLFLVLTMWWDLHNQCCVTYISRLFVMFTQQCSIFAASLQPVKPYLVNELLNEGYLGHKRLYCRDMTPRHHQTTQLCMLIQLMLISHEIFPSASGTKLNHRKWPFLHKTRLS